MSTKRVSVPALPSGSAKAAGKFDKAGRWYPSDEVCVAGSFQVRAPSRAWPYSYLKHFYSIRFSRRLLEQAPKTWLRLQNMEPESAEAAPYVALVAKRRLGVAS